MSTVMPSHDSGQSPRATFGFGAKIILIVLAILSISQALGTFLSVLSFEKVFLKALTSKYEILGKDLKRKIEQSLKFGKRLESFVGMDKLVESAYRQSGDINEIFLCDAEGNIIFTSGKAEFVVAKSVTDTETPEGKVLFGNFAAKNKFPVDELFDWNRKGTIIELYQHRYHVLFPIKPRFGNDKGVLGLVFKQSVVDQKKSELIKDSRNKLAGSILLTAVVIGLLIKFFFVSPANRQVGQVTRLMKRGNGDGHLLEAEVPEEVRDIQHHMADFISDTTTARKELDEALDILSVEVEESPAAQYEIRLMKNNILKETEDEAHQPE